MDARAADEVRSRGIRPESEDAAETSGNLHHVDPTTASALEVKYMNELQRSPTRQELREESISQLKMVLLSRGWQRTAMSGIDKEALIDHVLPYLDAENAYYDDEPLPLGSNCWPQLVLRACLCAVVASYVHGLLGLRGWLNYGAYAAEVAGLAVRNVRLRRGKRERLRKLA